MSNSWSPGATLVDAAMGTIVVEDESATTAACLCPPEVLVGAVDMVEVVCADLDVLFGLDILPRCEEGMI